MLRKSIRTIEREMFNMGRFAPARGQKSCKKSHRNRENRRKSRSVIKKNSGHPLNHRKERRNQHEDADGGTRRESTITSSYKRGGKTLRDEGNHFLIRSGTLQGSIKFTHHVPYRRQPPGVLRPHSLRRRTESLKHEGRTKEETYYGRAGLPKRRLGVKNISTLG